MSTRIKKPVTPLVYCDKDEPQTTPQVGQVWRYNNAEKEMLYTILSVDTHSVHTDPPAPQVQYQAMYDDPAFGKNAKWTRNLSSWMEILKVDDCKYYPRFILFQK